MKVFFFLLLAVIVVGGGLYIVDQMGEDPVSPPKVKAPDLKPDQTDPSDPLSSRGAKGPELVASKKARASKPHLVKGELYGVDVKRLWAKLRPPEEALVPDPDHVGPCPPVSDGGHGALVIRRYKEQETGYFVWIHEDGAKTVVSPDPTDLGASRTSPGARGYTITTMVPTRATTLSPEDDRKN